MKKTTQVLFALAAAFLPIGKAADVPRVYIDAAETVDGSNSRDGARQIDFGTALAAALMKKKVPVSVVTEKTKSQWTIKSVSSQKEDSTGTKIAKLAFGSYSGFTKFEARCRSSTTRLQLYCLRIT